MTKDNMSGANILIRGGQTTQHWVRMALQVLKGTVTFGALAWVISYATMIYFNYEIDKVKLTIAYWWAKFAVENRGQPDRLIHVGNLTENQLMSAQDIYTNQSIILLAEQYHANATWFAWLSAAPAILCALIAFAVFYYNGRNLDSDEHIRGTMLVTRKDLQRWVKAKWAAYEKRFGKKFKTGPRYTIAGIDYPPNAVEAQTGLTGTVGTGKTTALLELLDTVRKAGGKAIVYDRMGAFVSRYYDPDTDVIINPFDARSKSWSPFNEAEHPEFFTQIAEVFIPDKPGAGGDTFWQDAARIVFDYAAKEIYKQPNPSMKKLRDAILHIPNEKLAELVQSTPAKHFLNEEIAKTAGSIRATLIAELRFLEHLREDAPEFSIRDWVKNADTGIVFLTGDAEHAAATRNIISTLFEVAANSLMVMPQSNDPRIWFFMDEVTTLNRMPFLVRSLAEIRQFGGAFVIGYQVFSQLEETYGPRNAQTIVGNLNNRIVYNTPDHRTAKHLSESLGSEDVNESREGITVGAHETRDGVSFQSQRAERFVVTPSQIQSLPQFAAYLRFAYDAPTTLVHFKPSSKDKTAEAFVPYADFGSIGHWGLGPIEEAVASEGGQLSPLSIQSMSEDQIQNEFEKWRRHLVSELGLKIFEEGGDWDASLKPYFIEQRASVHEWKGIRPPNLTAGLVGGALPTPKRPKPETPPARSTLETFGLE